MTRKTETSRLKKVRSGAIVKRKNGSILEEVTEEEIVYVFSKFTSKAKSSSGHPRI